MDDDGTAGNELLQHLHDVVTTARIVEIADQRIEIMIERNHGGMLKTIEKVRDHRAGAAPYPHFELGRDHGRDGSELPLAIGVVFEDADQLSHRRFSSYAGA